MMKVYRLGMNYLGVLYYQKRHNRSGNLASKRCDAIMYLAKKVLKYYLIRLI